MSTVEFIVLILFHIALWWVVLSRAKLIFYALNRKHPAPYYFTIAVLLQSLHAYILSFNPTFLFDQKFYNTLAVFLIICSSHLFFLFGYGLYKTAKEFDGETIEEEFKIAKFEEYFLVFAIICTLIFEYFLGAKSNNLITPSAVDVLGDFYLLASRLVSFSYVVFCEWSLIRYVYKIFSTAYGNRMTVKLRGWAGMASTLFISLHYVLNPIATVIIFFAKDIEYIRDLAKNFYTTVEAYNGTPIAIFLLIATSPRWVINLITSIYIAAFYYWGLRKLSMLRDLLIKEFPRIALELSTTNQNKLSIRSKLSRLIIEISDGINMLLKYLPLSESAALSQQRGNPYQVEAIMLFQALTNKRKGTPISSSPITNVTSLKAQSLLEVALSYLIISKELFKIIKKNAN